MFANCKDTLLDITYADIQRLMFGVIKSSYNPKGIVKFSEQDKCDLVCHLISCLFEKQETYKPELGKPAAWMWTIARNECMDYLAKEQKSICKHLSIDSNSKLYGKIKEQKDYADFYTEEELDALDAEVSRLSKVEQLILELYRSKVSEKEIALRLGMNYNTVRQTIRRLKILLAERVKYRLEQGKTYCRHEVKIFNLNYSNDSAYEMAA